MSTSPWTTAPPLPPSTPVTTPEHAANGEALAAMLTSLIQLASVTDNRSLQTTPGASELGHECDRRISYRMRGVAPVNRPDPLRAIVGSGLHLWLAETFSRLDAGSGRFLVESPVTYRGTPGRVDLYDRFTQVIVDWKSTLTKRLGSYRRQGVPDAYLVQTMIYAAGLKLAGEDPRKIALVFVPVDGILADIWVHVADVDTTIADAAIDRSLRLGEIPPEDAVPFPSRLCPWCPAWRPGATDLSTACPGRK